ncbi:hypothetical protein DM860_011496 [Cuscuta australis]|uniref:Acyl-CoA oxidase C-alpha1 domain-containing protein n=1 Tax=Cuscuta australis TaxID=267555 RepID=A0A328D1W0_9ASTE|nr:hypothetical protein DM860_011496 [Cuscuta australis]
MALSHISLITFKEACHLIIGQKVDVLFCSTRSLQSKSTSGSLHLEDKVGIATAIRYSLTRKAISITPNGPEVLSLDYSSYQRRLFPLLAKRTAIVEVLPRWRLECEEDSNKIERRLRHCRGGDWSAQRSQRRRFKQDCVIAEEENYQNSEVLLRWRLECDWGFENYEESDY